MGHDHLNVLLSNSNKVNILVLLDDGREIINLVELLSSSHLCHDGDSAVSRVEDVLELESQQKFRNFLFFLTFTICDMQALHTIIFNTASRVFANLNFTSANGT